MTFSVKVDEIAANFFRKMATEKAQINKFVELFMKDVESEVTSEESFNTMRQWQDFLSSVLGDTADLTEEEVTDLNKMIRFNQTEKCSMVTQRLNNEYCLVIANAEAPLYKAYSLSLPRINKLR